MGNRICHWEHNKDAQPMKRACNGCEGGLLQCSAFWNRLQKKNNAVFKEVLMNFLSKVKGKVVALFMFLLATAAMAAANDYTSLTADVVTDISGINSTLVTIGGAIIGVSVVFLIVRFIRRMIS